MRLTPAQLEALADRFLAANGAGGTAGLVDLNHDSFYEFDGAGRSLRRRQRGSRVVGGGLSGQRLQGSLTAALPSSEQDGEEEEDFQAAQEPCGGEEDCHEAGQRRDLLDDFSALLDTHRLAARDRCTPRMAQIAAARQRVALALHGDLLGYEDFHDLHAALYSLPRARRDRVSRGLRRRDAPRQAGQADLFGDRP